MLRPAKPKREQRKNPSQRGLDSMPVLAVILGEMIDYLSRTSSQLTKESQILTAKIANGVLQVTSGHLQRLELPLASIPALARKGRAAQSSLQIAEDGSHLYWPRLGLHLNCKQLEIIRNRLSAKEAKQQNLALQHSLRLGAKVVKELQKAEGGAWSGAELRKKFGFSAADLSQRRDEYRIVYWRQGRQTIRYPQWQFSEAGTILPGIQKVLRTFRSRSQWRVMSYFLGVRQQLDGRRPLDLLRAGELGKVLAHAREHAAENTW